MIRIGLFLTTVLLLSACCSKPYMCSDDFHCLSVGTSTDELTCKFGRPNEICATCDPDQEKWIYLSKKPIGHREVETTQYIFIVENCEIVDKTVQVLCPPVEVVRDRGDFRPD